MFLRTLLATTVVVVTATSPISAGEMDDNSTATRLQIACPEARLLQFRQGHIMWLGDRRKDKEVRQCLNRVYGEIVADPFPVNMTGYCQATKVSMKRGKIILSC